MGYGGSARIWWLGEGTVAGGRYTVAGWMTCYHTETNAQDDNGATLPPPHHKIICSSEKQRTAPPSCSALACSLAVYPSKSLAEAAASATGAAAASAAVRQKGH